jgi:Tfp pilus assembly protein FimT
MSLLESCLTTVVISTVMAIAVPPLHQATRSYVLTSAASDVATRLQSARVNAVIRNCDCRLRVVSATQYVIECQIPSWTVIDTANMPDGITVAANARPEFHPRGNTAPAATVTVLNSAGQQKQIVVNIAGRIRIQ